MDVKNRKKLLKVLRTAFPNPHSELEFKDEYQLAVAVMLSAQCTDKKVNEVTAVLFKTYPSFKKLSTAKVADIEKVIRPVNYYKTKALNLTGLAKAIMSEHGGKLPSDLDSLVALPGIGRKTANVILCETGACPAFPVDTHVIRVSNRLGLSCSSKPDKVEEDLKKAFPPESWRDLHHQLILHGRRTCKARGPLCPSCCLADICPSCGKV